MNSCSAPLMTKSGRSCPCCLVESKNRPAPSILDSDVAKQIWEGGPGARQTAKDLCSCLWCRHTMNPNSMEVAFHWKGAQVRAQSRPLQQTYNMHVEKMEPGSPQQCMMVGWEAVSHTWNKTNLHWREKATSPYGDSPVQRGAKCPERLWCLRPWGFSREGFKEPWTILLLWAGDFTSDLLACSRNRIFPWPH